MSGQPIEARCTCGMHVIVHGSVPDPDCPIHGDQGINAWTTCPDCGATWRHVVGHACQATTAQRIAASARRWYRKVRRPRCSALMETVPPIRCILRDGHQGLHDHGLAAVRPSDQIRRRQLMTTLNVGALPPYKVTYIDPGVCATSQPQWFVMGTVDGNPRNGQGPVAICEYEPSAHAIAALLNASTAPGQHVSADNDRTDER